MIIKNVLFTLMIIGAIIVIPIVLLNLENANTICLSYMFFLLFVAIINGIVDWINLKKLEEQNLL